MNINSIRYIEHLYSVLMNRGNVVVHDDDTVDFNKLLTLRKVNYKRIPHTKEYQQKNCRTVVREFKYLT